ncbi:MAG: glutamine--tRNA ligase, partial [Bacteroidetes bacterium QH_2_64_26]
RDIDKDETRSVPFTREFYIERDDFREDPPDDFIRLAPGREVRLRHAYFFICEEVVRDDDGTITELRGTIDPETRGGTAPDGRSPDGTLHWVPAPHGIPFEARLYDRLFTVSDPDARDDHFTEYINPDSLNVRKGILEPTVRDLAPDTRVQFERQGYFWPDPDDSTSDSIVYNQIVPLRDTWSEDEDGLAEEELERRRREKEKQKQRQRERSLEGKTDPVEYLDDEQHDRFDRYHDSLGLSRDDAATIAKDDALADFFESALDRYDAPEPLANWTVNELLGELEEDSVTDLPFGPEAFADLVRLVDTDVVSNRGAHEVFDVLVDDGGDPEAIVDAHDLRQVDDTEVLRPTVQAVLTEHPDEVERYRNGKTSLIGFFMGQVMEATDGAANPELARSLLQDELST